jgi:non-ribosomal peptide synthase protein (TIGR01720 family)
MAYRGAYRWAQDAEPIALEAPQPSRTRVRERGTYLITGGLGGMGLAFAEHLARIAHARLVLVGRTALPPPQTWDELARTADDATRRKIEAVRAMEAAGGEVLVCAADVSDRAAMAGIVAQAKRRFGPIHGVIHAAGIAGGAILERQSRATVDAVFAPKVSGTRVIDELLGADGLDFMLLCSSLISFLGLPGRSEYISANAYVDAYARAQALRGRRDIVAVNWDTWIESGMAAGGGRPDDARNDDGMSDAEGMEVLRRLLAGAHGQVLVSVREFRPRALEAMYSRRRVTVDSGAAAARVSASRRRYPRPALRNELKAARNETERVLVEIWQDLLGIEAIGVDDNFFELGGDSVLGLQIVARARQAGLELRARQIFEHQSVAELAAVAGAAAAQAQSAPVTGEVPLTPIQCWFFEQALEPCNHFNQSMLLAVPGSLDPQRLAAALVDLATQHDALRCRYRRDDAVWKQQIAPPGEPVPLQVVDLSARAEADQSRAVTECCSELATQLDLEAGPLLRAGYFILRGGREGRLALIVHHLVVDAVSWPILIEDLQAAYAKRGNDAAAAQLGAKTTSLQEWALRLTEYAATSTLAEELSYWKQQGRPALRSLPVDLADGDNSVASTASVFSALTAQETRALTVEVHEAYHTRVTDLMLAALWEAFARWSGEPRIGIAMEGHGRDLPIDGIDLSRTVGWFTSMYPLYLEGPLGAAPDEIIARVKEQLGAVPRNGAGFGILRYLNPKAEVRAAMAALPEPEIAFLYFGQLDAAYAGGAGWTPAAESVGPQRDSRIVRRHLFEVKVAIQDGRLVTDWVYSRNRHREATVKGLVEHFVRALRASIAHCREAIARGQSAQRFTAGRLTQRELDAIRMQMAARGGRRP